MCVHLCYLDFVFIWLHVSESGWCGNDILNADWVSPTFNGLGPSGLPWNTDGNRDKPTEASVQSDGMPASENDNSLLNRMFPLWPWTSFGCSLVTHCSRLQTLCLKWNLPEFKNTQFKKIMALYGKSTQHNKSSLYPKYFFECALPYLSTIWLDKCMLQHF